MKTKFWLEAMDRPAIQIAPVNAECGVRSAEHQKPGPVRSICPLFLPLKREFFEAFKSGAKDTEYRRRGPRWNAETCWIGRRVVIALGYTKTRLYGKIVGFHYDNLPSRLPGWTKCYGVGGSAACIKIEVEL